MAGEIIDGKRTFIERNGNAFELPDRHRVGVIHPTDDSLGNLWVTLDTPGEGSLFVVNELEEQEDRVVLHLGTELGRHGLATWGGVTVPPVRGYPFPNN